MTDQAIAKRDWLLPQVANSKPKANPGYQFVSVNEQSFSDLGKLYAYLVGLPEDTDVQVILKAPTDAGQFNKQYHRVLFAAGKPKMIHAQ
jgi:hypothetical protein